MLQRIRSLSHDYSRLFTFLGVQPPHDAFNCRSIHVHLLNPHDLHDKLQMRTRQKLLLIKGRIGEVVPPASRRTLFTFPYSHLAALNGNPALRGQRPMPQGIRHG